jgi:hypothetical protein
VRRRDGGCEWSVVIGGDRDAVQLEVKVLVGVLDVLATAVRRRRVDGGVPRVVRAPMDCWLVVSNCSAGEFKHVASGRL